MLARFAEHRSEQCPAADLLPVGEVGSRYVANWRRNNHAWRHEQTCFDRSESSTHLGQTVAHAMPAMMYESNR
ncbi:hypothetical protein E1218_04710 [Kribbella turkmenica]|uniref:Uncharacterized protein n=1 Tax=Kribbella turkmenica TaxID=2530375 RepID=A0A4R4XER0_9ACTN|nr:hypothetical protein [Kribbella turkmenica]TDD29331.1 hypothetical protein E1218_04710 [Kribbella turkmenica]